MIRCKMEKTGKAQRRIGKMLSVLTASAALMICGAVSAQAAGWTEENGNWYYYENSGSMATDSWKRSEAGNLFYLGSDGTMQKDSVLEADGNYYYVNGDGVMVVNCWLKVDPSVIGEDGDEDVYMYFGSNGRAYKKSDSSNEAFSKRTINGKTYAFNENGRMLTGFVTEEGEMISDDTEDPFTEAMYYFGESDDGAMRMNGWYQYQEGSEAESNVSGISYADYETLWFYFGSGGKKVVPSSGKDTTEKTINGQKYLFDENGVMLSSFVNPASASSAASPSSIKYYSGALDGHLQKNKWIYAVPTEEMSETDYEDEQARWFYSGSSGTLYRDSIKKINGKRYVFDENGIMKSGFVLMDESGNYIGTLDREEISKDDLLSGETASLISGNALYYFGDSEDDGAMKTGKSVTIGLSDDSYTFGFSSAGKAYGTDGVESVSSRYYQNGLMLKADSDYKYGAVMLSDGTLAVVGTNGARQSGSKALKDGNDAYVLMKDGKFYAYAETDHKPVYYEGIYYEYDSDAEGKRGDEIAEDTAGDTLPAEMKLNFD
ncbi:MAG: hypothetical protein Q4C63_07340 [Eubacteriales bacterium]|nr:hypothetical protein [Eubacteriales bacterium]